ncbi:alpha/beta hydrolase family esterase [Aquabacterium sp.]|uniref:alpha/beta hydrolase family esterase n=1 Tax=Aquabacterium sp. TaxID=1872578 RepID=UPI0037833B4B
MSSKFSIRAVAGASALAAAFAFQPLVRAATTTVDPVDAATQLMDFGEKTFPQFFPKHQQNITSLPPYIYRYYPDTGIYLGVADGKVYVLGGSWPDITYVGDLGSFISPVRSSGLLKNITLPGFGNQIFVLQPAGATRAIVFLHGGGGTNYGLANSLGLNSTASAPTTDTADWPWLVSNKTIVVFPQGLNIPSAPLAQGWSNHTMTSGQDDVAFLKALAAYIKSTYGVSDIVLAGHSMGGAMTNRMWCEAPTTFKAYVSLAGPASSYYLDPNTPCNPGANAAPYYGIFAGSDQIMQNSGKWDALTWRLSPLVSSGPAFDNPIMIGEWQQYVRRAQMMCGETPQLSAKTSTGTVDKWSHCGGRLQLWDVLQAQHEVDSIQSNAGTPLINLIADFLNR